MTGVSYQRVTFYACCQVCKERSLYCRNVCVMAYIQRAPFPSPPPAAVAHIDVTPVETIGHWYCVGQVENRVVYGDLTQWQHPPSNLIKSATLETSRYPIIYIQYVNTM